MWSPEYPVWLWFVVYILFIARKEFLPTTERSRPINDRTGSFCVVFRLVFGPRDVEVFVYKLAAKFIGWSFSGRRNQVFDTRDVEVFIYQPAAEFIGRWTFSGRRNQSIGKEINRSTKKKKFKKNLFICFLPCFILMFSCLVYVSMATQAEKADHHMHIVRNANCRFSLEEW